MQINEALIRDVVAQVLAEVGQAPPVGGSSSAVPGNSAGSYTGRHGIFDDADQAVGAALRYRELLGTGRTSNDIEQILPAANEGRVETLLVSLESQSWGVVDAETGAVHLHDSCEAGDEDLLDTAAVLTLSQRGTVYALNRDEMPSGAPIAAVFRY